MAGNDRSSVTLIIDALQAASGASATPAFSGTLQSDVLTRGGIFSDPGRVTMRVIGKDPTDVLSLGNSVTITSLSGDLYAAATAAIRRASMFRSRLTLR